MKQLLIFLASLACAILILSVTQKWYGIFSIPFFLFMGASGSILFHKVIEETKLGRLLYTLINWINN